MIGLGLRLYRKKTGITIYKSFQFTWKTDNVGTSNDDQATLPFTISAALDCVVTWDDPNGSTTVLNSSSSVSDLTHTYSDGSGIKNISISGLGINSFSFFNGGDKQKILEVSNVVGLDITEISTFQGCTNLTWTATDAPTITTDSLWNTFRGCPNFNGNIDNWDVSNVTSMGAMFLGANSFNQPLNSWNMSNVNDVQYMFFQSSDFNQPLNNWDTNSITNVRDMFSGARNFDQDISSWDINQVTNFVGFFSGSTLSTTNYDLLLPAWDAQGSMAFSGTVSFGSSKYTGGGTVEAARSSLVTKWGGITDGGGI
jgi:surface protein